jgi:hypothetical protein
MRASIPSSTPLLICESREEWEGFKALAFTTWEEVKKISGLKVTHYCMVQGVFAVIRWEE